VFRALLTGNDDAGLIVAQSTKGHKTRIAGQEKAIERIKPTSTAESHKTAEPKMTSSE